MVQAQIHGTLDVSRIARALELILSDDGVDALVRIERKGGGNVHNGKPRSGCREMGSGDRAAVQAV